MILQGHIIHHHPFVQQIRSIFLLFYKTVVANLVFFSLGSVYLFGFQQRARFKHRKANSLSRIILTKALELKFNKFQKQIIVLSILQKNERKVSILGF